MSLITNMMSDFCFVEKNRVPDGAGGFQTTWTDGARFKAAIVRDSTMEAQIAEKQGVTSVYTITTSRKVVLGFDDVVRRLSDGRIFRVTSDAKEIMSPRQSTLDMAQVFAEKWELTS